MRLARAPFVTVAVYDPTSELRAFRFFDSSAKAERFAAACRAARTEALITLSYEVLTPTPQETKPCDTTTVSSAPLEK